MISDERFVLKSSAGDLNTLGAQVRLCNGNIVCNSIFHNYLWQWRNISPSATFWHPFVKNSPCLALHKPMRFHGSRYCWLCSELIHWWKPFFNGTWHVPSRDLSYLHGWRVCKGLQGLQGLHGLRRVGLWQVGDKLQGKTCSHGLVRWFSTVSRELWSSVRPSRCLHIIGWRQPARCLFKVGCKIGCGSHELLRNRKLAAGCQQSREEVSSSSN